MPWLRPACDAPSAFLAVNYSSALCRAWMIRCRRRAPNADTCGGTDVAAGTGVRVRVLEARFHPTSRSNPAFVVVGRVLCDGARATIERADVPAAKVRPFDALRLYEKLEFLVMS